MKKKGWNNYTEKRTAIKIKRKEATVKIQNKTAEPNTEIHQEKIKELARN
jgi:hypothetical protein